MADQQEPVTDDEIKFAFANTNFGTADHRNLLAVSVLKELVGYHCGHTVTTIMQEMGLIGKSGVTKRGKKFVAAEFNDLMIHRGG